MKTSFIIFAAFALLIFSTDVIKSQENRKNKDNFVFASTMGYWSNLHNSNNGNIYSQSEMGYGFKIKDRIFLAGKIAYRNYGSFNKRIGLGTSIIYYFFNNNLHPFF